VVTEELAGGESPLQLHSWAIEPVAKVPFGSNPCAPTEASARKYSFGYN